MLGATRTLGRWKGPWGPALPTEVTGRQEPLPTMMEDGQEDGEGEWKKEDWDPVWCGRRPPSQRSNRDGQEVVREEPRLVAGT